MFSSIKKSDKVLAVVSSTTDYCDLEEFTKKNQIPALSEPMKVIKLIDPLECENSSFDWILLFAFKGDILSRLLQILKPEGSVILHKTVQSSKKNEIENEFSREILKLKLTGFCLKTPIFHKISSDSTAKKLMTDCSAGDTEICQIIAEKPSYKAGSSISLLQSKTSTWKITSTVDDELIEEDDLIDNEVVLKKDKVTSAEACNKRKVCKDCTCGLASSAPEINKSSCGSCYLGDAFRCGECPYLGMPAFKPGQNIVSLREESINN